MRAFGKPWLWPDRTIGKFESGALRDEYNAVVNSRQELADALEELLNAPSLNEDDLHDADLTAIRIAQEAWGKAVRS